MDLLQRRMTSISWTGAATLLRTLAFFFVYAGVLYMGEREVLRDALAQYRAYRKMP